jgi:hypothetical protein
MRPRETDGRTRNRHPQENPSLQEIREKTYMSDFCTTTIKGVTSRADRNCFFCGELIPRGEKFHRRTGVTDGSWWTMYIHPECDEATKNWRNDDYETFTEGDMARGIDREKEWKEMQVRPGIKTAQPAVAANHEVGQ